MAAQVAIFAAGTRPGFQGWGSEILTRIPWPSPPPGLRSHATKWWATFGVSPSRNTFNGAKTVRRMAILTVENTIVDYYLVGASCLFSKRPHDGVTVSQGRGTRTGLH